MMSYHKPNTVCRFYIYLITTGIIVKIYNGSKEFHGLFRGGKDLYKFLLYVVDQKLKSFLKLI